MPHKRNPHESERVSGLARLLRGYAVTGSENVALWHERDISHSSTERVIFPDSCIVLDYMLALLADLIEHLAVYPERMKANLDMTGGLIYSQRVLLALIDTGMDRQFAYKLIQRHAMDALDRNKSFEDLLLSDQEIASRISRDEMNTLFDPSDQLRYVDEIFERLGLLQAEPVLAKRL
jgi:adenylosuccinate lyase